MKIKKGKGIYGVEYWEGLLWYINIEYFMIDKLKVLKRKMFIYDLNYVVCSYYL